MSVVKRLNHRLMRYTHEQGVLHRIYRLFPLIVLSFALLITHQLWQGAQTQVKHESETEFNFRLQEEITDIELRMETYRLLLQGAQGLFHATSNVSRQEFQAYVNTLDFKRRYPGIQSMGYSLIILSTDIEKHTTSMRRKGFTGYKIQPIDKRVETTSNIYIEPFSKLNQAAFGFNMYADSIQREAMNRARDTGRAALSGKTTLQISSPEKLQWGFHMYLPVYLDGQTPKSILERRLNIIGWVHATFRSDALMDVLSISQASQILLSVYDGDKAAKSALLSGAHATAQRRTDMLRAQRHIVTAGRSWTIIAYSTQALESRFHKNKPIFIAIAGIGTSILLALLMQMLVHSRTKAQRMAEEMTSELAKSEFRWKYALEGAGEGVWDWNITTGEVFLSTRLKEIIGYSDLELENNYKTWEQSLHPDDSPLVLDALNAYLEGKTQEYSTEGRMRCKDGSWKWILMRGMAVSRDHQGRPLRMIGTHSDISERHAKDEYLKLASTVFNTANEALLVTNANGLIIMVNPSFTQITGYKAEEAIGRHATMLVNSSAHKEILARLQKDLNESGSWQGEIISRKKSGEPYVAWVSISTVHNANERASNRVVLFSDISQRKATEVRIHNLAHYDFLTELPNRTLFTDRLRQALSSARRNRATLALMFIDLDKFKLVNDQLGHQIGDLMLKEVAQRLTSCIRESDTAARIGGDEFVALLPVIEDIQDANMVAEKILEAIEQPFFLEEHQIRISASIGIAIYPEHGLTSDAILTNADNAMYQVKHDGGAAIASYQQFLAKKN